MKEFQEFRSKITTLIRDAAKTVMPGTVSAVDEKTRTCTVKIGNVDYEEVRLYGLVKEGLKGFCFIPKVGSHVLAARIESSNELFIALFTEIDKVVLSIGEKVEATIDESTLHYKNDQVALTVTNSKVELSAAEIIINGGELGGLVKIEALTAKLNALIDAFNSHTHLIPSGGVAVTGSPSAQSNTAPVSVPSITGKHAKVKVSDYENTQIKQ